MRKRSSDFENRIKELKAKFDQIGYKIPRPKRKSARQIVNENLVSNFVQALTDSKVPSSKMQRIDTGKSPMLKTKKIDSAALNFEALNRNALHFMKGVLNKKDASENQLREAVEYGREIIQQLYDNIRQLSTVVGRLPVEQEKEVYNNIVKVVEVIERLEEKFKYSTLPDIEKKLYDLDKNLDDLKQKFGALAEEEGLDAVEKEIYSLKHPYLVTDPKTKSPYAQDLTEKVKEKLSFLKELIAVYQADKEPEAVRRERIEGHQKMLKWVEGATFIVKKDIPGLKGIKKSDDILLPKISK